MILQTINWLQCYKLNHTQDIFVIRLESLLSLFKLLTILKQYISMDILYDISLHEMNKDSLLKLLHILPKYLYSISRCYNSKMTTLEQKYFFKHHRFIFECSSLQIIVSVISLLPLSLEQVIPAIIYHVISLPDRLVS